MFLVLVRFLSVLERDQMDTVGTGAYEEKSFKDIRIVHAMEGRIRILYARATDPLYASTLVQRLSAIPGVDFVEANSRIGSLVLYYDPEYAASVDFYGAIASEFGVSLLDLVQLAEAVSGGSQPQSSAESVCEDPADRPFSSSTSILHQTAGRVRLLVPALGRWPDLAPRLVDGLCRQNGVREAAFNLRCRSVTILYDPILWSAEQLCLTVQSLPLDTLSRSEPPLMSAPTALDQTSGPELWLSSTGLALSILAEPVAAVALPVLLLLSALPMLQRARHAVAQSDLNVDVLDASAASLLTAHGNLPMAQFMVWLINIADYIRDATMMQSKKAIEQVLAFRESEAWVVRNGVVSRMLVRDVDLGDTVIVYPGERIPVDGTVSGGHGLVDQATLTGESVPVEKRSGDQVYASTVVRDGKLSVTAERIGNETEAARIVRLVESAPARETKIQNYAVKWANELVPYSFLGAGIAGGLLGGGLPAAAAVLIVDYGTGIRIAAPTTVLSSMTKAVRHGILIKGGRHLETLAEVDAIVFDKTGTLTSGELEIGEIFPYGTSSDEVLKWAAAAEQRFNHPVAHAIVRAAERRHLTIPDRTDSDYTIALGVEATVDGHEVLVGNRRFMEQQGVGLTSNAREDFEGIHRRALSPLCVAFDGRLIGLLGYADPIRPETRAVIREIRSRGISKIIMLSGDHEAVAQRIAAEAGISECIAEVFPGQKAEVVQRLQREGYKVAVVGDGINDSPALAHADVGIAVEGGTDIARETAHVMLLHGGLWKIPIAIDISREAVALIKQNWRIIAIPNSVALVVAAMGLLGPIGATILSNGSAIIATLNGLRPLLGSATPPAKDRTTVGHGRALRLAS